MTQDLFDPVDLEMRWKIMSIKVEKNPIGFDDITYIHTVGDDYKPCLKKCSVAPWDDCPKYPECSA